MTLVSTADRWLYVFDPTAATGHNLTGTDGQVGAFDPPAINVELQDLAGSASRNPVIRPVGYESTDDVVIPIWADSALQALIDDWHGTTASDRRNARIIAHGWKGADAKGIYCEFGQAYLSKVTPLTPPAQLTQLATTWRYNGKAYVGIVLHALSAATADGGAPAGSGIDGGASSALGGTGAWGYTTYTADGATGIAPRVVDSADDITYGSLITFTTATATTGGGQISTLAATDTVEQYVDCDWDFTGSPGAGTTCTFWVAFARTLA